MEPTNSIWAAPAPGLESEWRVGLVSMLCCATGGLTPISAKNIRAAAADRATKTKRRSILGSNNMMTNWMTDYALFIYCLKSDEKKMKIECFRLFWSLSETKKCFLLLHCFGGFGELDCNQRTSILYINTLGPDLTQPWSCSRQLYNKLLTSTIQIINNPGPRYATNKMRSHKLWLEMGDFKSALLVVLRNQAIEFVKFWKIIYLLWCLYIIYL